MAAWCKLFKMTTPMVDYAAWNTVSFSSCKICDPWVVFPFLKLCYIPHLIIWYINFQNFKLYRNNTVNHLNILGKDKEERYSPCNHLGQGWSDLAWWYSGNTTQQGSPLWEDSTFVPRDSRTCQGHACSWSRAGWSRGGLWRPCWRGASFFLPLTFSLLFSSLPSSSSPLKERNAL